MSAGFRISMYVNPCLESGYKIIGYAQQTKEQTRLLQQNVTCPVASHRRNESAMKHIPIAAAQRLFGAYYGATLLFLILDFAVGLNIRVTFLADLPGWRFGYYPPLRSKASGPTNTIPQQQQSFQQHLFWRSTRAAAQVEQQSDV